MSLNRPSYFFKIVLIYQPKPRSSTCYNSLLGRHKERHLLLDSHLETSMCETFNTLIGIIHRHSNSLSFEIIHVHFCWFRSVFGSECQSELSRSGSNEVCGSILITECVSTDYDWFRPSWDWFGDLFKDDGFSEYSSS